MRLVYMSTYRDGLEVYELVRNACAIGLHNQPNAFTVKYGCKNTTICIEIGTSEREEISELMD